MERVQSERNQKTPTEILTFAIKLFLNLNVIQKTQKHIFFNYILMYFLLQVKEKIDNDYYFCIHWCVKWSTIFS